MGDRQETDGRRRRLFGRAAREPAEPPGLTCSAGGDPTVAVRAAILRIADRRQLAARQAGRALATQAEVRQAVGVQRLELDRAAGEIGDAIVTARRSAGSAAADAESEAELAGASPDHVRAAGALASAPYEQAAAGFERQLDVVRQAVDQLDALGTAGERQVGHARAVLAGTVRTLDAALAEHVRLLVGLERAERARVVAEARLARARRER